MELLSLQLLPQLLPPQQRQIAAAPPLSQSSGQPLALRCFPIAAAAAKTRLSRRKASSSIVTPCRCSSAEPLRSGPECSSGALGENRRWILGSLVTTATALCVCDIADAVSSSRRALRASKIPETDFTTLPNGLKYYDLKVGAGAEATKGSRVAVHYVAKWKGITFMTSRQGLGVGGGTPYGFDVGQSERGSVMKGLDFGVLGMKVGGQRFLIVPPELAYGKQGVQEIPPNATIEQHGGGQATTISRSRATPPPCRRSLKQGATKEEARRPDTQGRQNADLETFIAMLCQA